jgi:hypothetical protein
VGIGATVFFTGLLAALAGGYALFTVFQSIWIATFFGLLWGALIFNLDRFIVSSMRKNENSAGEWKIALPRLVLALLLALVISKPLELKLFEREINRKLDEKKTAFIRQSKDSLAKGFPEIQELELEKVSLQEGVASSIAYRNQLQQEYDAERFGVKTARSSGLIGLGSNAKKKEAQLDAAQGNLDRLTLRNQQRTDALTVQIEQLRALRQVEFEKQLPGISGFDGFAARMEGLAALVEESEAMATAQLFLVLLFLAIETAPIFVKLLAPRGPYDDLLALYEDKVALYKKEKWAFASGESDARLRYFEGTNLPATERAIAAANSVGERRESIPSFPSSRLPKNS